MRPSFAAAEEGAALVEAALVLPILLLLVLGIAEASLYAWNVALAGKAAQLGVRRAIVSDAVAIGPGLDGQSSTSFWGGLPPGARCRAEAGAASGPCPEFAVRCTIGTGCRCLRGSCGFLFSEDRLRPIIAAMAGVLPSLKAENVEISYETNGLGYVSRPGPVPVDVRVTLTGLSYRPLFLGELLGQVLPLSASELLPSESLETRR